MGTILKRIKSIFKANKNAMAKENKSTEELIKEFESRINEVKVQLFELKKLKRGLLLEFNKQESIKEEMTYKIKYILSDKQKDEITKEQETKEIYSELKGIKLIQEEYVKQIKNIENSEKTINIKIAQLQDIMVKYKVQNAINGIKKNNITIMNDINTSVLQDSINYEQQFLDAYEELSNTKDELENLSAEDEYKKFINGLKEGVK